MRVSFPTAGIPFQVCFETTAGFEITFAGVRFNRVVTLVVSKKSGSSQVIGLFRQGVFK